jgi:spermidine/putrescine transport system ATP-binding protein
MSSVSLESISKSYGRGPGGATFAVRDVDLDIAEGEFVVLLGPSGCGKTTTLRMIAGFVDPTHGKIRIGGDEVNLLPPRRRDIGMVFQNYALFPNMTVAENIGFGLRQRKVARDAIKRRVREMLELIHLADRGDDYIDQLSGGQQQRVALARALAASPRVLLMDEPLGALDMKLRESLQVELLRLQRELKITTILVTHDQQEAMVLADRVVIMADGKIQQVGTPRELYQRPANAFVANFIGKTNLICAHVAQARPGYADLGSGISMALGDHAPALPAGTRIDVMVRPEHIELVPGADASRPGIPVTVEHSLFLGNVVRYFVRTPWNQVVLAERFDGLAGLEPGASASIWWQPAHGVVFEAEEQTP